LFEFMHLSYDRRRHGSHRIVEFTEAHIEFVTMTSIQRRNVMKQFKCDSNFCVGPPHQATTLALRILTL